MTEQDSIRELLDVHDPDLKLTEKQIRIIEAAIESFSEKGYSATTTSEIAKKAGVAEGTIFKHYKTKKDLLLAIIMPTIYNTVAPLLVQDFVKKVFEQEYHSFEAFLRSLVHNRFQFAKKRFPILRIFAQEVAFHGELQQQLKESFTRVVNPHFSKVIRHFQEKGEIIDYPVETVMRMIISSAVGHLITRFLILPDNTWDDELELERTVQFIVQGLKPKN